MSKELFVEEGYNGAKYYDKDAVDALLAEKEKEIAYWREEYDKETQLTDALKDEIESLKASHYAEMVDAGMRERRLHRALWLARAARARSMKTYEDLDNYTRNHLSRNSRWDYISSQRYDCWFYAWDKCEQKCLKKAKEYK